MELRATRGWGRTMSLCSSRTNHTLSPAHKGFLYNLALALPAQREPAGR